VTDRAVEIVAPRRSVFSRMSFGHVLMIFAGLMAFVLNVALLRGGDETVDIAVARSGLDAGQRLSLGDLAFEQIPAAIPLADRLVVSSSVEPLLGQVLIRPVAAGAPLFGEDLRPAAAPDSGRAMSIPIPPNQAVAGDLARGDRVDVVRVDGDISAYAAVGLEVLQVEELGDERFASSSGWSVTLRVDELSALEVASAFAADHIFLVRSTGSPVPDTSVIEQTGEGT
jgi:Flp pilus assembly protein CpaB